MKLSICYIWLDYHNIIPFSNDTKDTGSVSFLSLPRLDRTDLFPPSPSYTAYIILLERDRHTMPELRCVDNNRCSEDGGASAYYTITILFNYIFSRLAQYFCRRIVGRQSKFFFKSFFWRIEQLVSLFWAWSACLYTCVVSEFNFAIRLRAWDVWRMVVTN